MISIVTMKKKSVKYKQKRNERGIRMCHYKKINNKMGENQDGGVGRHTAPPRTTRTDRESNGKGVRHQVDKK